MSELHLEVREYMSDPEITRTCERDTDIDIYWGLIGMKTTENNDAEISSI